MVLEVSSDPSEAVSVLAGMSPTATNDNEASGTNGGVARFVGSVVPQSTSGASYGSAAAIGGAQGGNARQAKTLQAMRAQRSSAATAVSGLPNDEEKAREGGQGRRSDAELKKVAAFISSYAGIPRKNCSCMRCGRTAWTKCLLRKMTSSAKPPPHYFQRL